MATGNETLGTPQLTTRKDAPDLERRVRLFVSSTFLDMQAERDALVKNAFQRLRALCEDRGIAYSEVDLRWGITREAQLDGRVLAICFEQIDACRPYFLGILGQRYGSRVAIPAELLSRHGWLQQYLACSVTELEFRYAMLRAPKAPPRAFFYLREHEHDSADSDPSERAQSRHLRDEVRSSASQVSSYTTAEQLAQLAYEHLAAAIAEDFPDRAARDLVGAELARQRAFSQVRARGFVGRGAYLDALDAHLAQTGPPLVLSGPSGVGKSAILAAWLEQRANAWQARHPSRPVARFFVGASSLGGSWRQLCETLIASFGFNPPRASSADGLRQALQQAFERVAQGGPAVVVLDALNQLDPRDGALELAWLPPKLPAGLRLIIAATPGVVLSECLRRNYRELAVEHLDPAESRQLTVDYLAQRYGKQLVAAQQERLLANPLSNLPLWLTAVLEELRLVGQHEQVDTRLGYYAATQSVDELFGLMLERWERDYSGVHGTLVKDALTAIVSSRHGMTEGELQDLLAVGVRLTGLDWAVFVSAAGPFLIDRSGLLGVYHDQLRRVIEHRYLPEVAHKATAHRRLAELFSGSPPGPRRRSELPWQHQQAGDFAQLRAVLSDEEFLDGAWAADPADVQGFWTSVEGAGLAPRTQAYDAVLAEPEQKMTLAGTIADLFSAGGFSKESLSIYERLRSRLNAVELPLQVAQATLGAARLNGVLGRPADALSQLAEAEATFRRLNQTSELMVALGEQAHLFIGRGDLNKALDYFERADALAQELADDASMQSIRLGRGEIFWLLGKFDAAREELDQAERLALLLGDQNALQRTFGHRASLAEAARDFTQMLYWAERQIELCEGLGDRSALGAGLVLKGLALAALERLDEAQALYERAATLNDEIGDISRAADVRVNLAVLLARRFRSGELTKQLMAEQARGLLREQLAVYEQVGDNSSLGTCLCSLGVVEYELGDVEGGIERLRRAIRVETNSGRLFTAAGMRVDLADTLLDEQRAEEATGLLREALRYHTEHDKVPWALARLFRILARASAALGNPQEAFDHAALSETWARQSQLPEILAEALEAQATLLEENGQHGDALPLRQAAVAERLKTAYVRGTIAAYTRLARTAAQSNSWDVALAALSEQWRLSPKIGERESMAADLRAAVDTLEGAELQGAEATYRDGLRRLLESDRPGEQSR